MAGGASGRAPAFRRRVRGLFQHGDDPGGGPAVAEGIGPGGVSGLPPGQQIFNRLNDGWFPRAHQTAESGLHGFGTFGHLAQHKHPLVQRRGFLLHAPGIAHDEQGSVHKADKLPVAQRPNQRNIADAAQVGMDLLPDMRVQVRRRKKQAKILMLYAESTKKVILLQVYTTCQLYK